MTIKPLNRIASLTGRAVCSLLAVVLFPGIAAAGLSGVAELGYVKYDSEINGTKNIDASTFQQRYSLLYDTAGTIGDARFGRYKLGLGYEWASFDTRIKSPADDSNPAISAGHVLFLGEVVVDPKEIPLRFKAYSRDLSRTTFIADTVTTLADTTDRLLAPGLTTSLLDGTHISSGATLVLGVKNGMTNGYSSIYRELPMLLLDYKDEIVRDLKSQTPTDTRLSKLAFVSLNKKDNWFHYRRIQYRDYIDKTNDYLDNEFQLGTVDETQSRRWIDFTNWIKISTDLQFTTHNVASIKDSEQYDVNLFAIATRSTWEGRTFNNFTRTMHFSGNTGVEYSRRIPVYLNGIWGADTDWRVTIASEEDQKKLLFDRSSKRDNLASFRVDTFKLSPFTLAQAFSVERYEFTGQKSLVLDSTTETASTRRFSDIYALAASYNIKNTETETDLTTDNYLTQTFTGRGNYTPSRSLRFTLDQTVANAIGQRSASASPTIAANSLFSSSTNSSLFRADPTTGYTRSITTLATDWQPAARLRIGLSGSEDILWTQGQPGDYYTTVRNTVDYTRADLVLNLTNSATQRVQGDLHDYSVSVEGKGSYTPNRTVAATLRSIYGKEKSGGAELSRLEISEGFNYYLYTSNGVSRRLLEVNQGIEHTQLDYTTNGQSETRTAFTLGCRYYPLRQLFVASTAKYSLVAPGDIKELISTSSLGMSFSKLQASLDYSYGKRYGGDNRVENRFAANLKKQF